MKRLHKIWITQISLLLLCTLTASAQTWLPSFFSDNMVLQQNKGQLFQVKHQLKLLKF